MRTCHVWSAIDRGRIAVLSPGVAVNEKQMFDRISRILGEVERLLTDNDNASEAKERLLQAKRNLERINASIDEHRFNSIAAVLDQLLSIADAQAQPDGTLQAQSGSQSNGHIYQPVSVADHVTVCVYVCCSTGRRGRPRLEIPFEQLRYLYEKGYSAKRMAQHFKCSVAAVYKLLYQHGMKMRQRYTNMSEEDLTAIITNLSKQHPNSGTEMINGYLRSQGILVPRQKIRSMLRTADPVGTASRWGRTVARRTYFVPTPNSLWHIDGHMKLIRWGFVTHGGIDGYSRMVVYLNCSTTNQADVVQRSFVQAAKRYGLPSRVRSDYGSENIDVALLMNLLRGSGRGSHITGQSVHNERIERLWRDVHKDVTSTFYKEFYKLEDNDLLHIDSPTEMFALKFVYLDEINQLLEQFRNGWNSHKIRTEQSRTPHQIWLDGFLENTNSTATVVREMFQEEDDNLEAKLCSLLEANDEEGSEQTVGRTVSMDGVDSHSIEGLDNDQMQQLRNAVDNTNGGSKLKYRRCVTILNEMLR
ncbi:hypothetical protein BSL78_23625 [Apostichopus japonicus]|uniref:Integrase catalytic domain-containing protein n=1 Tax=Stichopus japonicus TaxID=307972 RepID=A0A2G8JUW3_STIJA|nr:hypothetical protein BSL78_23625 [Apostichopus japonicus]